MKKRALISVFDKTHLENFARRLKKLQFEILSTGKTAKFLRDHGVEVEDVSDYTGFPEILGGRVKTLHPKIHGGILMTPGAAVKGIEPIDLVVVNLYPFEKAPSIENIDIGGPAMLRAAAKNYESVTVVCDPADYDRVAVALEKGEVSLEMRKELAGKVFARTARYETAIAHYFGQPLRYGENPHQQARFQKASDAELLWEAPLQGKELSYNNILDADAAWWLMQEFKEEPFVCAIIKHTNPCGVAISEESLREAFEKAYVCDPTATFGGIVIFNHEVDEATAGALAKIFLEIILAPSFSKEAIKIFGPKKNLRLLEMRSTGGPDRLVRSAGGGLLSQDPDRAMEDPAQWKVKTKRAPTQKEREALQLAWKVVKHIQSNAIVFSSEDRTLGIGAGQMSRIDAVHIAATKLKSKPIAVASDAFFPFPDNIEAIAKAGATAIIQPGGSIKDTEVIAAADKHNLAMVFTGVRHFRH